MKIPPVTGMHWIESHGQIGFEGPKTPEHWSALVEGSITIIEYVLEGSRTFHRARFQWDAVAKKHTLLESDIEDSSESAKNIEKGLAKAEEMRVL